MQFGTAQNAPLPRSDRPSPHLLNDRIRTRRLGRPCSGVSLAISLSCRCSAPKCGSHGSSGSTCSLQHRTYPPSKCREASCPPKGLHACLSSSTNLHEPSAWRFSAKGTQQPCSVWRRLQFAGEILGDSDVIRLTGTVTCCRSATARAAARMAAGLGTQPRGCQRPRASAAPGKLQGRAALSGGCG